MKTGETPRVCWHQTLSLKTIPGKAHGFPHEASSRREEVDKTCLSRLCHNGKGALWRRGWHLFVGLHLFAGL
jgi:hypothetical protein